VDVFVETPRDERVPEITGMCAAAGFQATFRTAGLHHAVRNADPATGFEQHGFLNLRPAGPGSGRSGRAASSTR
jgi:hypothetical protein